MFENTFRFVGGKIKSLAKILFLTGLVICVIGGATNIVNGIIEYDTSTAIAGVVSLLIGPILTWCSSLLMYGFGQLVENSDRIAEQIEEEEAK